MVSTGAPVTLERKIFFYRPDIGVDDGGRPLQFDVLPALTTINSLPFSSNYVGRYDPDVDGNAICVLVHSIDTAPAIRFCRVRRTGLPQLEHAGQITDLDLDADTGLLESVHAVFFSDGIVGAEYNHFGPRISRLGSYLHEKSNKVVERAIFRPLLRGDAAGQLDRLTDMRLLDYSVLPPYVEYVEQADRSLGSAFAASRHVLENPKTVQVTLTPAREAQRGALGRLRGALKELISNEELRNGTKRMQVRGKCADTNRVETIDLLKDQLISTKSIVRMNARGRALNPDSAFQAIREAYYEQHDQLVEAAGISP